jgi:hypothetical protein
MRPSFALLRRVEFDVLLPAHFKPTRHVSGHNFSRAVTARKKKPSLCRRLARSNAKRHKKLLDSEIDQSVAYETE